MPTTTARPSIASSFAGSQVGDARRPVQLISIRLTASVHPPLDRHRPRLCIDDAGLLWRELGRWNRPDSPTGTRQLPIYGEKQRMGIDESSLRHPAGRADAISTASRAAVGGGDPAGGSEVE